MNLNRIFNICVVRQKPLCGNTDLFSTPQSLIHNWTLAVVTGSSVLCKQPYVEIHSIIQQIDFRITQILPSHKN